MRLLLVEDNAELLELISFIIGTRQHFDVLQVREGRAALEAVEKEAFAVIITDLVLKDFSGLDLIRRVRELGHATRLIAISGKGPRYLQEALAAGADAVVAKPFTIAQIVAVLEPTLGGSQDGGAAEKAPVR